MLSCGTPEATSAFCAAIVATSDTCIGPSQMRRSRMPATSSSRLARMPRRCRAGCSRCTISAELRRTGASMWATLSMETC